MALRADDVDLGRDRDLVERFQSGDPAAFDDLYRRYFDRLHRFCQRHTSDSHEAEEVAQEAFVKALRSMHSLSGERRFYPWMTVIAKRISIDRHRKAARVELTDEPDLGSVEADIEHLFAEVDAGHVRDAMTRLGPRHREVLLLREAQGLSYADIAAGLDVPVTTVEALLHRARKALRREFATVSGETRGMLGLPVLGWLASRTGRLRSLLADRWAEAAVVAAPAAVAALTAAVVLGPAAPGTPAPTEVRTGATTTSSVAPTTSPEPGDPVTLPAPATASTTPTPVAPTTTASPTPAAPAVDAGPVDVFLGPEGASRARDEARRMPVNGEVGPATAGIDPQLALEDTAAFLDGLVAALLAPPERDPAVVPTPLQQLLGGSR